MSGLRRIANWIDFFVSLIASVYIFTVVLQMGREVEGFWRKVFTLGIEENGAVTRTCGRYICHHHVFDFMERFRPRSGDNGSESELDEVPVYQAIIEEHGALGCVLPLPLFDVGHPAGYAAANGYWARNIAPNPSP